MAMHLEFVQTGELLTELYSRYDAVVFVGVCDLGNQEEETHHGYAGGRVTCIGLCIDMQDFMMKQRPISGEMRDVSDELDLGLGDDEREA